MGGTKVRVRVREEKMGGTKVRVRVRAHFEMLITGANSEFFTKFLIMVSCRA
jgi:hypothetical protein